MFSDHWTLDPAFRTRSAEPPTTAKAGENLEPDKSKSAMATWANLTAQKRSACNLEDQGVPCDDVYISKAGGTPLFSQSELDSWPICIECGDEMQLRYQLFTRDIACLLCPKGADCLQLYFCPNDCGEEEACFDYRWIDSQRISSPIDQALGVPLPARKLVCAINDDYPNVQELGEPNAWLESGVTDLELGSDKRQFLDAWDDYHRQGDKVGGYVHWVQNAWSCCDEPLYLIAQVGWGEGLQYIMGCGICGKTHTEYQGT